MRVRHQLADALHGAVHPRLVHLPHCVRLVDAGHLELVVDAVINADKDSGLGHVGEVVALADDVRDAGRECQSDDDESDQE